MKIILFVILSLLVSVSATANLLPVEYFANLPDVRGVSLSPGGNKLSAIVRIDYEGTKGVGVQVTNMATAKKNLVLFTDNSKYFIHSARWKDDTTLLVNTWYPSDRDTWLGFTQVRHKSREGRLLIINTDTGKVASPFKTAFLRRYRILPSDLGGVVNRLYKDPDHILMSIQSMDAGLPSYPMVVKVNIKNQNKTTIQKPSHKVFGWGTGQGARVRSAYHYDDGKVFTRIKDDDTGKWRELWPYDVFSEEEVEVLGFDRDPNTVYISAYHNDFKALFKVDLTDKELKRELVYSDPNYDVNGSLMHSLKDGRVLGVGFGNEDGTKFLDPSFKQLQAKIDRALPNTRNFIYSITESENNFIVYSTGTTESGTYYLGTKSPIGLKAISYSYKKLPPKVLADVKRIEYKTRDGIDVEAYLTLPKGLLAEHLPTIMFPHGGPMARDSKAFDYWAQFFANRGYAVLQMNFRGSDGLGFEFRNSGLKKWGREMQDDIEDGALELIEKGIADPDRICIVGASYGGYAALMGIVKTPDRYQCAISVNGVSSVLDLARDYRNIRDSYNIVDEIVGDNHKHLKDISPVNHVDKISAPVLLIHGELDRQVDIKHSHKMHNALIGEKKEVTFVKMAGEDHYLANETMRVKAFKAMDEFLAKHLPVTATH